MVFDDPREVSEEFETDHSEQLSPRHQRPDDGLIMYSR
jgi:hypothetical protein